MNGATLGSSDVHWLLAHRSQLIEGVRRAATLAAFNPAAAAFMSHALELYEAQVARAAACREAKTAAIEAGVLAALGCLPIDRHTAQLIRRRIERAPHKYGLESPPHLEAIRQILKARLR